MNIYTSGEQEWVENAPPYIFYPNQEWVERVLKYDLNRLHYEYEMLTALEKDDGLNRQDASDLG